MPAYDGPARGARVASPSDVAGPTQPRHSSHRSKGAPSQRLPLSRRRRPQRGDSHRICWLTGRPALTPGPALRACSPEQRRRLGTGQGMTLLVVLIVLAALFGVGDVLEGLAWGLLDRRRVDRRCSMVRLEKNSVRHITSHVTHSEGSQARTCPLRQAADPQPKRSTPAHDIPTRRRRRCSPAPPASPNMAGETTPDDHASSPSAVPRRRRWRPSSQQTPFGVRELPRTTSSSSSST